MSRVERPYQLHLGEETPRTIFRFDEGTVIYPLHSRRGVLRNPVFARETKGKAKGLTVFESLSRVDLYFDGQYWSLPEGSLFAAYKKKAKKVKIK